CRRRGGGTLRRLLARPPLSAAGNGNAARGLQGAGRLESRGAFRRRAQGPVVDGLRGCGARRVGGAGGRRQPKSQGRLRAAAASPCSDRHSPGRLPAESRRRRQRDANQGLGKLTQLLSRREKSRQRLQCRGGSVLRDRSVRPGAQYRRRGKSLRAELAADYFMLRGLDTQQQLLDRTVADFAKALELTENLYQGGAAAVSDVQQAKAQLETARTQAEDTRLHRAQTEHAIAVLVGRQPSGLHLEPRPLETDAAPPVIDPGLPSQLLERRPDVAAAERRVASANAAIGVARAAYFPTFSLAGALGLESTSAGNWMQAPSRFWSVGP